VFSSDRGGHKALSGRAASGIEAEYPMLDPVAATPHTPLLPSEALSVVSIDLNRTAALEQR
jgi:hypothetical protein